MELHNILRWNCTVRTCTRGQRALKLIHTLHPDILVLDLMLPELDGISLLEALSVSDCRPAILATTNLVSNYILTQAQRLHVDYLICKPCSLQATAARIQDQLNRLETPPEAPEDLRGRISEILLLLGVSVKLHGYQYLKEAIHLMLLDPSQSLTKELYPAVAQTCGCSPCQVERSIRGAIHDAWKHLNPSIWQLYFQSDPLGQISRPTNAVFIARIADGLKTARLGAPADGLELISRQETPPVLDSKVK